MEESPALNLSVAILRLMNESSGTAEEIARDALSSICSFVQDQGDDSYACGGMNSEEGFAAAAAEEYKEVFDYRAAVNLREESLASNHYFYNKLIDGELVKKYLFDEISKEELNCLNKQLQQAQARLWQKMIDDAASGTPLPKNNLRAGTDEAAARAREQIQLEKELSEKK